MSARTPRGKGKARARDKGDEGGSQTSEMATEEHTATIQSSLDKLVAQVHALREQNAELRIELEVANEKVRHAAESQSSHNNASPGKSPGKSNAWMVRQLQQKVDELTEETVRQKHRIDKMKQAELKREVQDLEQPQAGESGSKDVIVMDKMTKMKKLLRRFADLMVAPIISPNDRCAGRGCWKVFVVGKCSELSCQHIICHDCLPKFSKGADETVRCPQCKEEYTDREDLKIVDFTPDTRWDVLVQVAQAWYALDKDRTEMETSEEDDERRFINDTPTENSAPSSDKESESQGPAAESDDEDERASTPTPTTPPRRLRPSVSPKKRRRIDSEEEDEQEK